MLTLKHLPGIIVLGACIPLLQMVAQPVNLTLGDTTISSVANLVGRNSIRLGPNFTIGATADASLSTGGSIYFVPPIILARAGRLRAIKDASLLVHIPRSLD